MNICGILLHAHPDRRAEVEQAIEALEGAELHHTVSGGRMIVTVEDTSQSTAGDTVLALHGLPGVLSAALVYHHFEPQPAIGSTTRNTGE
ncbi:MAG: chaperone NapD [Rhodospirillales bacterium]|nr:MAG: chaperone NapD [Rhodospirillales bacterium]